MKDQQSESTRTGPTGVPESHGSIITTDWKKYMIYDLEVDPKQEDRAKEIKICTLSRPHMRAFHASWWSFFVAFFTWFAITPLLGEIRDDLDITAEQLWTSSIAAVGGTIIVRFMLGPACDKYGARVLFAGVLCAASIPSACTGLITTAHGLTLLRLCIGIVGGTFVMCQYWTTTMFTKEVAGTANALVGGWGNLGAGVTQVLIGSLFFPLLKAAFGGDSERAWRRVSIIPAVVSFITGIAVYFFTDDCPKGNYEELKRHGRMKEVSMSKSFISGALLSSSWLLFFQYACCFGVELTMNNAAALYFRDEFGQSTESAAAIASIFGWMNLFARGMGGFFSDYYSAQSGMRGRLWVQTILLMGEGIFVIIFASTKTLAASIMVMICFSLFVQAAEGSTYGIVPYVSPQYTGTICGIVGAGGNVGAAVFGLAFRQSNNYQAVFIFMGICILISSCLSFLIFIPGQSNMFTSNDELFAMEQEQAQQELSSSRRVSQPRDDIEENNNMQNNNGNNHINNNQLT